MHAGGDAERHRPRHAYGCPAPQAAAGLAGDQRSFSAIAVRSFHAIAELLSTSGRKSHGVMP